MSRPDFTKTWASSRPSIPAISGPDYALGFANYLGAIPPSTDDHDYIMNLQDQRSVWLGEQMLKAVGHEWQSDVTYDQYAVVRSPVNGRLYRSLVASNLGNEPSASPSQWSLGIAPGSLLNVQVFTANGTYTPTLGTRTIIADVQGGGGQGGGSPAGAAGNVAFGRGGHSGARLLIRLDMTGIASIPVTVGAGGSTGLAGQNGQSGGTSSLGSYATCPGGPGGQAGGPTSVPGFYANDSALPQGTVGSPAVLIERSDGNAGQPAVIINTSAAKSGSGGGTVYGVNLASTVATGPGANANQAGAGGAGGLGGGAVAAQVGGQGGVGRVIIYEYS